MKPFIDSSFWSDPDIEGSKPGVKLAALWLITNSQTSLIGLCGASPARFEFETGLKAEALETAIQALPRAFRRFGPMVFVTRYIHHQYGRGDKLVRNNFFVALRSLFGSIKDDELRRFFLAEYPEFNEHPKGFEGLTKPKDGGRGEEGMGKQKKAKASSAEVAEFFAAEELPDSDAEWFFHKCEGNGWTNNGKPIRDWKATVRQWRCAKILPSLKNGNGNQPEFLR